MAMPNLTAVVQRVRDSKAWDFRTRDGLCAYSNAVIEALHRADPNFGHLVKSEGQNHCTDAVGRRHAVDAALYRANGQIVDFIGSAGSGDPPPANPVTWGPGLEGEYDPQASWFAPHGTAPLPDPTHPVPVPPDTDLAKRFTVLERTVEENRVRMEAINERFDLLDKQNVKKGDAAGGIAAHVHDGSIYGIRFQTGGPKLSP